MNRGESAVSYHSKGCNCAQSLMMTFKDKTGFDESACMGVSAGFGGGVRSGEICGAASGAVMVIGKVLTDSGRAGEIAGATKRFVSEFRERFGCVRCMELKQAGHPCDELIEFASELCEKYI